MSQSEFWDGVKGQQRKQQAEEFWAWYNALPHWFRKMINNDSKYQPHQGAKEKARRLRQMEAR
jgi:hypothetical protein